MRWLRRRIATVVGRSVALCYGGVAVIGLVGLKLATGAPLLVVVPWALLGGQLAVAVLVARAATTNPLSVRYLRDRSAHPRQLSVADSSGTAAASIDELAAHPLVPLATVWDTTDDPHPLFDLFQTPQRSVTVVRNRISSALTLLSRLDDGRILLTDTVATAPHRRLVVNLAPDDDLRSLLARHLEAIDVLKEAGVAVRADGTGLFIEAQAIEQVAFTTLGPVLGPFYNLSAEPALGRFLVGVGADELMTLALDRSRTPLRARPEPVLVPA